MGKKSRMKAERRQSPTPVTTRVRFDQAMRAVEDAAIMDIYDQLQDAIKRERRLFLNDQPFSHPENAGKLDLTFGPIETWLDEQVRTGEALALRDGTVVFQPEWDSDLYPVGDSFISVAETYQLIAADLKIADEGDGLLKVGKRINADMPLDLPAILTAKKSLAWMRSVTMSLSPRTFQPYADTISTREELKRCGILNE